MEKQRRGVKRGGRGSGEGGNQPTPDKMIANPNPKPPISTILQAEDISGSLDKLSKAFFGSVVPAPPRPPKIGKRAAKNQPVERKGPARIAPRPPVQTTSFLITQTVTPAPNFGVAQSVPFGTSFAMARAAAPPLATVKPLLASSARFSATRAGAPMPGLTLARMAVPVAPLAITRVAAPAARFTRPRGATPVTGFATALAVAQPMAPAARFAVARPAAPMTTVAVTRAAAPPPTRFTIPRLEQFRAPSKVTKMSKRAERAAARAAARKAAAAAKAAPAVTHAAAPVTVPLAVTCTAIPAVAGVPMAGIPVAGAAAAPSATAATQPYNVLVLQASDGSHNRIMLVPANSAKPGAPGVASGPGSQGILKTILEKGNSKKKSQEEEEEDEDEGNGERKRCRYFWEPSESMKQVKALKRKLSTIWLKNFQVLEQAIGAVASHFPLVCPQRIKRTVCFPYAAADKSTYLSWPVPKQRASEWLRASDVRRALRRMLDEQRPVTWMWSRELITRKKIMLLCRKLGLTPSRSATNRPQLTASAGIMPFQQFPGSGRAPECRQCGRTFPTMDQLVAHLPTHAANWPYKCSVCSRAFRSRGPLVVHERNHLTGEPYACDYCLAAFPTKDSLVNHIGVHTGDMPYECRLCTMFFAKKVSLVRHMRTHTGEKPFKCSVCSMCFRVKAQLRMHAFVHTGEKPHKCPHCTSAFMLKASLKTHMRIHANEKPAVANADPPAEPVREFECRMCSKQVKYKTGVDHYSRFHGNRLPRLCRGCLAELFQKRNLQHADKPHKCRQCSRAFTKMWGLVVHMRKHSKGKSFKCEYCTREFKQNSSFVIHVRTHKEGKQLKCWVCSQLFDKKEELVEHLATHPTKSL
ncbi:unnamed protein product [Ixodes hexagonus]